MIDLSAPGFRGAQDLSRSLRSGLVEDRREASRSVRRGPGGAPVTGLWRTLERRLPDGFRPGDWLWILPAGSVPAPDALEMLEERLWTVTDEDRHGQIRVVGAKQLHADGEHSTPQRPRLVDVGLAVARSRETLSTTDPWELDQGQYDGADEVSAVSACGMLVDVALFADLGGFLPTLDEEHAAGDFARRAREAGAHVVVAPRARIGRTAPPPREEVHRLGGTLHLPPDQRRGQIRRRLTEAAPLTLPFLWVGLWIAAFLRLIGLTAVKAPDAALRQFGASASALLGLGAIHHSRRSAAWGRRAVAAREASESDAESPKQRSREAAARVREGRRRDDSLRWSSARLRDLRRRIATSESAAPMHQGLGVAGGRADGEDNYDALLAVGAADGEFDEMPSRRSGDRLLLLLTLLGLTGVALLAHRDLLTAEALVGGAALPVSSGTDAVFAQSVSFVSAERLGELAAADPFNLVLLVLSGLTGGHASTALVWLTVLALPLAALTSWWAAKLWTSAPLMRIVAALLWTAVPALHAAMGDGRIGTIIVHILLPVLVLAAVRAVGPRPAHSRVGRRAERGPGSASTGSWEHAALAGLLLAVITAAAPALLPFALVVAVGAAATLGGRGRPLWLVPLPALALSAPMILTAAASGGNVLASILSAPTRLTPTPTAPLWQQLLGHDRAFGPDAGVGGAAAGGWLAEYFAGDWWALRLALVIGLPLLVVALLGILTAGRRDLPTATSAAVLLGALGWSALLGVLAAGEDGAQVVAVGLGPVVVVIAYCVLTAAVSSLERLPRALPRVGGVITPVTGTLLVFSVIASLGFWAAPRIISDAGAARPLSAVDEMPAPVRPGTVQQVPATAADQGLGPAQLRTLVLGSDDDGVYGRLMAGEGRSLDSARSAVSGRGAPLIADARLSDDAPWTREPTTAEAQLEHLIAAMVTPGSGDVEELMEELAVGFVVIPSAAEGELVDAVDTAAGLVSVGPTDYGLFWRAADDDEAEPAFGPGLVGADTAWARILDAEGATVALLPSDAGSVELDLADVSDGQGRTIDEIVAADDLVEPLVLQLSTASAAGWAAEVDGEDLRSDAGDSYWAQRFVLPADLGEGELTAAHRSMLQLPLLIGVAGFLLLVVAMAVPLPRSLRMLPVVPGERDR
ncbi:glycosyltransferase family 2 protein [Nesterenkonia marinintestina]|uniref:glycosyltransferase family 2 protein n=1 Tax=Nesterenkonia marinintestina TaxID=2979865 RepID=UPI0021C01AFA|nr:hypothetical protein [Nesterenkonia sp. GX14115]